LRGHRLWAALLALPPLLAIGQPFTLDETLQPLRLDLAPVEGRPGAKAVWLQGSTIGEAHHFYVKGHGMLQPIDVILEAPEKRDLTLEIFYGAWDEPDLKDSTGPDGIGMARFTAYGAFGIRVSGSSTGVPYLLTVYASPERLPEFDSPFVPVDQGPNPPASAEREGGRR
jgi:hypothetical protein